MSRIRLLLPVVVLVVVGLQPNPSPAATDESSVATHTTSAVVRDAWAYYYERLEEARRLTELTPRFVDRHRPTVSLPCGLSPGLDFEQF